MNIVERIVYVTDIVCALVLGLAMPLLISKEGYDKWQEIGAILGNNLFVIAIAVILAAGASGGTMYVMVRTARHQPMIVHLLIKLFVYALPALATGYVVSMVLGWLGFYEASLSFFAFFAVGATLYFCAGIAGIAAMNSTPEYKQVLRTRNKDQAAVASQSPSEPVNGQ